MRLRRHYLNREGERSWWLSFTGRDGRYHRIFVKGWWSGPWRHHRYLAEIEFAIGGEDNMVQARVSVPFIGHAAIGVRVPRSWTRGWIYQRRAWSLRGPDLACGEWASLRVAYDDDAADMGDYYRRARERGDEVIWSRAATWPGWSLRLRPRVKDRLLGRVRCTTEKLGTEAVVISLPEGDYEATATLERRTWKRARWPRSRSADSWYFKIPRGLPVPGKGENSWDCDEDATFGMSFGVERGPLSAAIEYVVASTLRERERRGGPSWKPKGTA